MVKIFAIWPVLVDIEPAVLALVLQCLIEAANHVTVVLVGWRLLLHPEALMVITQITNKITNAMIKMVFQINSPDLVKLPSQPVPAQLICIPLAMVLLKRPLITSIRNKDTMEESQMMTMNHNNSCDLIHHHWILYPITSFYIKSDRNTTVNSSSNDGRNKSNNSQSRENGCKMGEGFFRGKDFFCPPRPLAFLSHHHHQISKQSIWLHSELSARDIFPQLRPAFSFKEIATSSS